VGNAFPLHAGEPHHISTGRMAFPNRPESKSAGIEWANAFPLHAREVQTTDPLEEWHFHSY